MKSERTSDVNTKQQRSRYRPAEQYHFSDGARALDIECFTAWKEIPTMELSWWAGTRTSYLCPVGQKWMWQTGLRTMVVANRGEYLPALFPIRVSGWWWHGELNSTGDKSGVKMKRDRWTFSVISKLQAGFLVLDIKGGQTRSKTVPNHKVLNLSLAHKANTHNSRGIHISYLSV